jgi:hypothetical protein
MAYGLLTLLFLWFRPQGLVPERRQRYPGGGELPLRTGGMPLARGIRLRQRPAGRLR